LKILLLATYRPDDAPPALLAALAELERTRAATELNLPPLAPPEVAAMVQAILAAVRPLRADLLAALVALTEGNPFFVEEVIKSLLATGAINYGEGQEDHLPLSALQIPRTVQVAVGQRAARLSTAVRNLLDLAAVAGRRFEFTLLQGLTGLTE